MGILSGALTSAITVFVIKDAITLYGAKVQIIAFNKYTTL